VLPQSNLGDLTSFLIVPTFSRWFLHFLQLCIAIAVSHMSRGIELRNEPEN
jgi:hypothetical protein